MCGIIGYIGEKRVGPVLDDGLSRLEYRGYDSSGVVWLEPGKSQLTVVKKKGKLSELRKVLNGHLGSSSIGIGHTRWATHGAPSDVNAHPHLDESQHFAIVQNGIFENYGSVRDSLRKEGYSFRSQTDAETAAHLLKKYYRGNLTQAFRKTIQTLNGYYALVAMSSLEPDKIVAFKRSNPLIIGLSKDGHFVASDVSAVLPYTRQVIYLEDDEYAVITKQSVQVYDLKSNRLVKKHVSKVTWDVSQAQKGGYAHFMLKEIEEQPRVCQDIIDKRIDRKRNRITFDTLSQSFETELVRANRVLFVSCGTAFHASIVGRYLMEEIVKVACEDNVSSEFRYYGDPLLGKKDVVILVSQSGETADTIAALKEAKRRGARVLAICNVVGSTIAREADAVIYTHAGPEIGVASTKAYVAQLVTLSLLAVHMAFLRKTITQKEQLQYLKALCQLPNQVKTALKQAPDIEKAAEALKSKRDFLYLARGFNVATALEGALKLKEISYIHAHGYAAGEMKHGPIALVDKNLPIVCIAPQSRTHEKATFRADSERGSQPRRSNYRAPGTQSASTGLEDDERCQRRR